PAASSRFRRPPAVQGAAGRARWGPEGASRLPTALPRSSAAPGGAPGTPADTPKPEVSACAPPAVGFRVRLASAAALRLRVDFGDRLGAEIRLRNVTRAAAVTAFHQYGREGIYALRAAVCGHQGPEVELGPYYVAAGHRAVSVLMNSSSVHQDEVLVFSDSHPGQKSPVVMHCLPRVASYNVSFLSRAQAGCSQARPSVTVRYQMQPVSVYTNGTVFATDTDIIFVAVTKETTALEFTWHFGDGPPVRTTSRSIRRRLAVPQWYRVTVTAASGMARVVSPPHVLKVQRRVEASRLVSAPTALVSSSVAFECRVSFGTDVAFRWDFGDGTVSPGSGSASHIYSREGEFTVRVLAFNDVSSAALRTQLFVVRQPCQPPPVKNMGPEKVQVRRSQPLRLGVTFEAAVLCNISRGLSYTWRLTDAEGSPVALPAAVDVHRQTLVLPGYTLDSGNYTATAKVQIRGSVVHSNYSLGVEVRARAPVAVISEGTHLFVPRAAGAPVTLRGTQSYDPDHPGAALSYHWTCAAARAPGRPCFDGAAPRQPDPRSPTWSFAAERLSRCCDQFLVTLTVASGGRSSSEARVFLSTRDDPAFRLLRIAWLGFEDISVSWNQALSLRAVCEACGEAQGLSYSWELFRANATEDSGSQVPFCSTSQLLGTMALTATGKTPESDLPAARPGEAQDVGTPTPSPQEAPPAALHWPVFGVPGSTSMQPTVGGHGTPTAGDSAALGKPLEGSPRGPEPATKSPSVQSQPPPSSSPALDDFEAYYSDIQEAEPARGRQPGNSARLPGSGPSAEADAAQGGPGEGDSLLGPFVSADGAPPVLTIDWPKAPVRREVFQGYTAAGITKPTVTVQPYSLRSGETYVLQASVAAESGLQGRAQLYVSVRPAPQDTTCQLQPHRGREALTVFSIFCMSGTPDFHYEFSYRIGNTSRHTLYRGRDTQYYFALPAGDPLDNYKVVVSTEIADGQGSRVQPCSVEVTVLPRYHGNSCPSEDLYSSSLRNLSTLQLMGSDMEIRNYVAMLTWILSRLAKDNTTTACDRWSLIQDKLISAVCTLAIADQDERIDSALTLRNLVSLPIKLRFPTAARILRFARALLRDQAQLPGRFVGDGGLGLELILLVCRVWEAAEPGKLGHEDFVQEEGMKVISEALLGALSLSPEQQLSVSTGQMEFRILLQHGPRSSVQSLGPVLVHLPGDLARLVPAGEETQSLCYISQLTLFRKSPYPWGQAAGQVEDVVDLALFSCPRRSPVGRRRLETPMTVEFGGEHSRRQGNQTGEGPFSLLRGRVNVHRFSGLSPHPRESLQIHIEFAEPETRAFPVLLLLSFSRRPSPADFLVRQTHFWDTRSMQVYTPAAAGPGASVGYLSLLDANYDRSPPGERFAEAVNYTVRFQRIRCLFWDRGEWKLGSFPPRAGTSPDRVNCSYDRLAPFAILRRTLNASFEASDVSQLHGHPRNLLPSLCVVVFAILGALAVMHSRLVERHAEKRAGCIFPQGATPPGHQPYAVVVDTSFWSPARFTSRVFIVLCGENGLSETKELCCPERTLFERNSRHTFILSTPAWLGPLQHVRLWHDSSGPAPSWRLSRVAVKDLRSGQAWLFPARCWLAAGRGDGRVERELPCLHHGLGFRKLFYAKFAESLESGHTWLSLCTPPGSHGPPRTQRLALCLCLLCVHACLTALATARGRGQLPLDVGPTDLTLGALGLGLLCALAASLAAQLLSLLLRHSKEAERRPAEPLGPGRKTRMEAPGGPNSRGRMPAVQVPSKQPAAATVSGRGTACPALGLETSSVGSGSRHCPLGSQGPSAGCEGLAVPGSRAGPPRPSTAAWTACGLVSLACGLGTGFLGYGFLPAQCARWLLLLSLSVVFCAFVTQPLLICCSALGFAWRSRGDSQCFAESLHEATGSLPGSGREECAGPHIPAPPGSREAGLAEVLAARQRERHLRRAQPPSRAQLRATRERMRRERHAQAALRDIALHVLALLLLLWMTHGTFSADAHSLSRAIRKEFVSNARYLPGGLGRAGDRSTRTLSSLLEGLCAGGPCEAGALGAQPGALEGKCYLLGAAVIKRPKASTSSLPKLPWLFPALLEDALPLWSSEDQNVTRGGPGGCGVRRDARGPSPGQTRCEASAVLTALTASGWMDGSAGAVSVHLALYNPATQLFASVTLSVDAPPNGQPLPSAWVESFRVFGGGSASWYHRALPELAFLVLSLVHLSLQLSEMAEGGTPRYWRKPRNWLELPAVGVAFAYYVANGLLAGLAGDVADQVRQGPCRPSLDLRPMALQSQRVRWLRGLLFFLWTLKCVSLPGLLGVAMPCCSRVWVRDSAPSISAPVLVGALLLAAYVHLRHLLCAAWVLPPHTSAHPDPRLLPLGFPRRSQGYLFPALSTSRCGAKAEHLGALATVVAMLCLGVLRVSLLTCFQKREPCHGKSPVKLEVVATFAWRKMLAFLGLEEPELEEAEAPMDHSHHLDEFSSLLDELLLKINALSDGLELPAVEGPRATASRAGGSPEACISGYKAPRQEKDSNQKCVSQQDLFPDTRKTALFLP
ncbi:PREDICTED: polycystic kidney disease protein 1-like 1, partial [Chinchilla lanigera]|uniref:polycystic kidney disease protein 1-like 1 n=1 Tax=Chinchilla lanigera TaxID=34839 RepID=UPI0006964C98